MKISPPTIIPDTVRLHQLERELARRSFFHFQKYRYKMAEKVIAWNWHHEFLCELMECVYRREKRRVIVNVPPGSLKSETLGQAWQAWMIGQDPSIRSSLFSAAGTSSLAKRDVRATLAILKSPWFQTLFPETGAFVKETETEFVLETGAFRYATGAEGQTTGFGGHHLMWDDLLDRMDANSPTIRDKRNEWMSQAFAATRLRDRQTGTITGIMQRLHEDDPTGFIKRKMELSGGAIDYEIITIPMENKTGSSITYSLPGTSSAFSYTREEDELLHESWISRQQNEEIKASLIDEGFNDYEGQYNQNPIRQQGNFFDVKRIEDSLYTPRELPSTLNYYLACDPAITKHDQADYTCIWVYGVDSAGDMWFMDDPVHDRLDSLQIIDKIVHFLQKYEIGAICLENGQITKSILPVLDRELEHQLETEGLVFVPEIWTPDPIRDKRARAFPARAMLNRGNLHFPDNRWMRLTAIPEMRSFTGDGDLHDDVCDTIAWSCIMLREQIAAPPPAPEPDPGPPEGSYEYYRDQKEKAGRDHSPRRLIGGYDD